MGAQNLKNPQKLKGARLFQGARLLETRQQIYPPDDMPEFPEDELPVPVEPDESPDFAEDQFLNSQVEPDVMPEFPEDEQFAGYLVNPCTHNL